VADTHLTDKEEELQAVLGEAQLARFRKVGLVGRGAGSSETGPSQSGDQGRLEVGSEHFEELPWDWALPETGPGGRGAEAELANLVGTGNFAEVQAFIADDLTQLARECTARSGADFAGLAAASDRLGPLQRPAGDVPDEEVQSTADTNLTDMEEELHAALGEDQVARLRQVGIVGGGGGTSSSETIRRPEVLKHPTPDPTVRFSLSDREPT